MRIQSNIPARFSLWKYVLSQIHDRYISVMTAFGKEIGYSLVTFCFSHQVVRYDQVPCSSINVLRAMEMVWNTVYEFNVRNFLLKLLVQRLPLSKHQRIRSGGGCINDESNNFLVHFVLPDWLGPVTIIEKGCLNAIFVMLFNGCDGSVSFTLS